MMRGDRDDRGSAATELVVVTPAIVLLLLLVVMGGRLGEARADVNAAARDAARAGSIARAAPDAVAAGSDAARSTLDEGDVTCRSLTVGVDTSDFRAGGTVTASVTCVVDLGDLAGLRVPATRTVTATFTESVDTYRAGGS